MARGTSGARKAWLRPVWYISCPSNCLRGLVLRFGPPVVFIPSDWIAAEPLEEVGLGKGVHAVQAGAVRVAAGAVLPLPNRVVKGVLYESHLDRTQHLNTLLREGRREIRRLKVTASRNPWNLKPISDFVLNWNKPGGGIGCLWPTWWGTP